MKKALSSLLTLAILLPLVLSMGVSSSAAVTSSEGKLPFTDVETTAWYYDSASFCYVNGIITGQGNTYTFAPTVQLSRAAFVVMLARVMKADLTEYTETYFIDVEADSWYGPSVIWSNEMGYVNGIGDGTNFGVTGKMTRQQFATMLYRILAKEGIEITVPENVLDKFKDKPQIGEWAEDAVKMIVASGVMQGTSETTFAPTGVVTRAQVSAAMMRFLKDVFYADCEHEIISASCTEGERCSKCGLIFTLPAGHQCDSLSCKDSGICNVCGEEVAADAGLHVYSKGDCVTPEKCSVCGDVRKEADGHKFVAATCTSPKKCTVCNATEGEALGHTTKLGICKRCNAEVFSSDYWRVAYYMTEKAVDNGDGTYEEGVIGEYINGDYDIGGVYYDANKGAFSLVYNYVWSSEGGMLTFIIDIPAKASSYSYVCIYSNDSGDEIYCYGEGTVNPVSKSLSMSYYQGDTSVKSSFRELSQQCLEDCIFYADEVIYDICGGSIAAFGF